MEQQLTGMRLLRFLLPKQDRRLLKDLPAQLDHIAGTVDDFYVLLGPRRLRLAVHGLRRSPVLG